MDSSTRIDREWIVEHAQPLRLMGAGVCQLIALILIISAPFNFVYGWREIFTALFMLAGPVLLGWFALVHHWSDHGDDK